MRVGDVKPGEFMTSDRRPLAAPLATLLCDDVDLEQLQAAVLGVAQETLQPAHVSLWVRKREPARQKA